MPYHVGGKGTNGCKGYPVVEEGGKVVGCHPTRAHADAHLQALYANVPDAEKSAVAGATPSFTVDPRYPQVGQKNPEQRGTGTTGGRMHGKPTKKKPKINYGRMNATPGSNGGIDSGGPGGSLG